MHCKNCGTQFEGNYCNNCGQRVINKRYTVKDTLKIFIEHVFNLEKGFFYTIKELFINPGTLIRNYIDGKTIIYYNPFRYLILIAGISILFSLQFDFVDIQQKQIVDSMGTEGDVKKDQLEMMRKMKDYTTFILLLTLPFTSIASYLIFKSKKYFYAEHIILNTYILGQNSLIGVLLYPFYIVFPFLVNHIMLLSYITIVIYFSYAAYKFFQISAISAIIKSILSLLLGYLLMFIVGSIFTVIYLFLRDGISQLLT